MKVATHVLAAVIGFYAGAAAMAVLAAGKDDR